ncbi:methyl-accepting chemotaxis protein [Piscinibacter gummiphilus]|uniref:Uncharacterized protein n=1 Tax=Piscinibacter gummiphilus TaxID=946333 RepID=A0A1W6L8R5_9BURK|nr:methyl-accepting chemotaxis protein [Piscinibacter gummiphilus]ARN20558.1 hypothetical protein A4W93_12005 [Piscinibacter gummiphilus]ATU65234.1 hypothetical protein CPZ87_12080 [Piscinibacter gummiphilus]GLS98361.1 hypothetical protein GCM10007918_56530 [Piscinibacter gummiphilus]
MTRNSSFSFRRLGSWRISTRLTLLAVLSVVTILLLTLSGGQGMRVATRQLSDVYQNHAVPMGTFGTALDQLHRSRMSLVLAMETSYARQAQEHIDRGAAIEKAALESLEPVFAALTREDDRGHAEKFKGAWAEYRKVRDRVAQLMNEGDRATAISEFRANLAPPFDLASAELGALLASQVKGAADTYHEAEVASRQLTMVIAAAGAFGLVTAIGLCGWLARSILRPLREVSAQAGTIARGDLTEALSVTESGEAGELQQSLVHMQQSLQTMVAQVRAATENITTASGEIATGNLDMSHRTEQAASNLQQTAASMEQLTGTVRQSAESARLANQLASSATGVAAKGGEVVARVVSTMDDINASSRKISDIIGVIDGIAFQTNILALNAAVEAARAGEQGRGFAVVASEVRSLAQRSAQAAKEIKSLIGASVEKVESGARLVKDAGSTMGEIVMSVQRVSDIIQEITVATGEQSTGLGQINTAVTELDHMTQQNAALVEQSAAAAESLKDQAGRLAMAVGAFKIS